MNKHFIILLLFLFFCVSVLCAQGNELYESGLREKGNKNIEAAKKYFNESSLRYKDAASFYYLGCIQSDENTFESRNLALQNFKEAALREPGNIAYRFAYAKLLVQFAFSSGIKELENVLQVFPKNVDVLCELGNVNRLAFENLVNLNGNSPTKYSNFKTEFFNSALSYYVRARELDRFNKTAEVGLVRIFEKKKEYYKAISLLEEFNSAKPGDVDINLYLGILYFRTYQTKKSLTAFENALSLMNDEDKKVYTIYSVEMFLEPAVQPIFSALTEGDKEKYLTKYWEMKDPFFLTKENERVMEHYFRVAYSNLYFGVPRLGIPGWKSDRGKVFISFGEPASQVKNYWIESYSSLDQDWLESEDAGINYTWYYPDGKVITFDQLMYNNYKLSWTEATPILPGFRHTVNVNPNSLSKSLQNYEDLRYVKFAESELKSDKKYILPVQINTFKSLTRAGYDDVFLSYILPMPDNTVKNSHFYSLNFYTDSMKFVLQNKGFVKQNFIDNILKENRPAYELINTIKSTIKPEKLTFAFETMNEADSLVSSLHQPFDFIKFDKDKLDASGLIFAASINEGEEISGAIKRNNICIIPKIGRQFKKADPVYIYYEAYNLTIGNSGSTDFEHIITISPVKEKEAGIPLKAILKGISNLISGNNESISLTTDYKTKEKDAQIYMLIDLNSHKPGKYNLALEIHDKISDQRITREWEIEITE